MKGPFLIAGPTPLAGTSVPGDPLIVETDGTPQPVFEGFE
jgi:hypothetical protein